jgi:hypothetical protein
MDASSRPLVEQQRIEIIGTVGDPGRYPCSPEKHLGTMDPWKGVDLVMRKSFPLQTGPGKSRIKFTEQIPLVELPTQLKVVKHTKDRLICPDLPHLVPLLENISN